MDVAEVTRQRIKEVRTRKGWSQRDLAAKLKDEGLNLDPASIARIETGARQVKVTELVAFAAVLEVPPMYLMLPAVGTKRVDVTPSTTVATDDARAWFRAFAPLPGGSDETMRIERGDDDVLDRIERRRDEVTAMFDDFAARIEAGEFNREDDDHA